MSQKATAKVGLTLNRDLGNDVITTSFSVGPGEEFEASSVSPQELASLVERDLVVLGDKVESDEAPSGDEAPADEEVAPEEEVADDEDAEVVLEDDDDE